LVTGLARRLAIAEPPVDAVAVHGAGPSALADFRRAESLHWLLSVLAVPDFIRQLGVEGELAAQTDVLVDWLSGVPPDDLVALLAEPALRIWLADLRRAALSGPADTGSDDSDDSDGSNGSNGSNETVVRLVGLLPLLLAAHLHDVRPNHRWLTVLPGSRRLAPVGWRWRLRSASGRPQVAHVESSADVVTVEMDGRRMRLDRRDGTSVGPVADGQGIVEPRLWVAGVELLPPDDFPELALARSPGEHPSELDHAAMATVLASGMAYLDEHWPDAHDDVRSRFRAALPISAPGSHIYSASTPELPLVVKLTIRDGESPSLLAETLVHETAHGKLESLWDMAGLLEGDGGEARYHHPWRQDRRPLRAVFLAAHAFANVMVLYQHAAASGIAEAEHDLAILRSQVAEALDTLERHALFTPAGAAVFDRLRQLP
jgi:HEXXH motif-containing protein